MVPSRATHQICFVHTIFIGFKNIFEILEFVDVPSMMLFLILFQDAEQWSFLLRISSVNVNNSEKKL